MYVFQSTYDFAHGLLGSQFEGELASTLSKRKLRSYVHRQSNHADRKEENGMMERERERERGGGGGGGGGGGK